MFPSKFSKTLCAVIYDITFFRGDFNRLRSNLLGSYLEQKTMSSIRTMKFLHQSNSVKSEKILQNFTGFGINF